MRIPRLYTDQTITENQSLMLTDKAAHYLTTVLRMKTGRSLIIFNGTGGEYEAVLETVGKKGVNVAVGAFRSLNLESPLELELGICLIKNDPMDWVMQKAVELGVSTITPLISEYTDQKLSGDRLEKKQQHWQQIAVSACEQCGRTIVPAVKPLISLDEWLPSVSATEKFVLHPYESKSLEQANNQADSVALLIGPEGGLTDREVELARQQGFMALSLGPRILRADTAAVTSLALLQSQFGDW